MPKTIKYKIIVESIETEVLNIEVSKNTYYNEFERMIERVKNTKDTENPVENLGYDVREGEATETKTTVFLHGCTHVLFERHECKKGYYFTN